MLFAVSTLELTLRMGVALTLILGIMYLATRLARRQLGTRGNDRPHIDVQYQRQLTKHATLSLIKAGDRSLLVASNNQAITLLAEGDDLTAVPETDAQSIDIRASAGGRRTASIDADGDARPRALANPIKALQNRTVRRG